MAGADEVGWEPDLVEGLEVCAGDHGHDPAGNRNPFLYGIL